MTNPILNRTNSFRAPPELQKAPSVKDRMKNFEPASKFAATTPSRPDRPKNSPSLRDRAVTLSTPKPVQEVKVVNTPKQEDKQPTLSPNPAPSKPENPVIISVVKENPTNESPLKSDQSPKPRAATLPRTSTLTNFVKEAKNVLKSTFKKSTDEPLIIIRDRESPSPSVSKSPLEETKNQILKSTNEQLPAQGSQSPSVPKRPLEETKNQILKSTNEQLPAQGSQSPSVSKRPLEEAKNQGLKSTNDQLPSQGNQSPLGPKGPLEIVRYSIASDVPPLKNIPNTPLLKGEWTKNFDDLQVIFDKRIKGPVFSGGAYLLVQERSSKSEKWTTATQYQVRIAVQYYQHWYSFIYKRFEADPEIKDKKLKIVCHLEKGKETVVDHNTKILSNYTNKAVQKEDLKQYAFIEKAKMDDGLMRVMWPEKGPFKPCYGESSFSSGIHPQCTLEVARNFLPIQED